MSSLILPRRFTQQPQSIIQPSSVLGNPAVMVVGGKPIDYSGKAQSVSWQGTVASGVGPAGALTDLASGSFINFGSAPALQTGTHTGVIVWEWASNAGNQTLFVNSYDGYYSSSPHGLIVCCGSAGGEISLLQHEIALIGTSSNGSTAGNVNVLLWSYNDVTGRWSLALNGVLTTGVQAPVAPFLSFGQSVVGKYYNSAPVAEIAKRIYAFAFYPRDTPGPLLRELSTLKDVWQIFKAKPRRYWIGAAAGGGAQTLTPTLYTNSQTFYAATVAAGSVTLTPTLFTNSQTFYAPTVAPGAVTLTAGLFTNSNTFYGHTLTTTYGLVAALFTNSPSFYAPTVSVGSVTLAPTLFSNTATFYAHTVSQGAAPQTLTATLYSSSQTFYAPTVTAGTIALTATRLDNAQTFYVPVVTISGGPQYLVPGLYSESQTFYSPSVVPGSVTLTATRFDNAESFYAHTVSQSSSSQTLVPGLFIDSQTFYTHTLTGGVATLIPSLYSNDQEFYSATVVNVGVFVIPTARSAQGKMARRRLPQLSTRQRG